MSDLVGNPEDRFSRVEAQFIVGVQKKMSQINLHVYKLGKL